MTTLAVKSVSGSWLTGLPSSPESAGGALVIKAEFSGARPLPLPNTRPLETVVARFEQDSSKAEALRVARRTLAAQREAVPVKALARLRLMAGLSQAQLAALADTSQPHIFRIEQGTNDPGTSLVARLAAALGVSEVEAFQAIRTDQAAREQG